VTYVRWTFGGLLLLLGALNAYLAWTFTTCTQGAADSLYGWIITLPLYVLGWAVIPKRGSSPLAIVAVASPAILVTGVVAAWTLALMMGASACKLITGLPFEADGREGTFAIAWGGTCLAFWAGLGIAVYRGWSSREADLEQA
jgi:hypothetical protein